MLEDWYRPIRLRLPFEQWEVLPQFAGYKSEYLDGEAVWTPRPKSYNAVLDLHDSVTTEHGNAVGDVCVRSLEVADWDRLPRRLAGAFGRVPPFCTLDEATRLRAAEDCLRHTRSGGDGEFLREMSAVALDHSAHVVGALLVTRWDAEESPLARRPESAADAHITWVFTRFFEHGRGIGTAMLHSVVTRLRLSGFTHLYTTFLRGNESSMLWHWRNGFRLLPYAGSLRTVRHAKR